MRLQPIDLAVPDTGSPDKSLAPKEIIIGQGGPLPKELILKVIKANEHKIRACVDAARASRPDRRVKVRTSWVIGPDGTVSTAQIHGSSLDPPRLDRCITREIQGWTFPRPLGGGTVEVRYPFVFEGQASMAPAKRVHESSKQD